MKRVLILEGGGAMGLMQIKFLTRLEQETGKKISEIFDLIAGTSVGAITGSVLAMGMSANEFFPIFYNALDEIFKTKWYNPFGIIGPKYDRKNFENIWNQIFNNKEILMKDVTTPLMITSVDRVDNTNHYFRSWNEKYSDWRLDYAVMASFAAPYYFGQMVDEKYKRVWFDGGVGISNCPMDQAYVQAIKMGWLEKEKVQFTIVGTGKPPKKDRDKSFKEMSKEGLKSQIADYMSPTNGGLARRQAKRDALNRLEILSKINSNIEICEIDVETNRGGMDDISKKTKEYLVEAGDRMMDLAKERKYKWS